MIAAEARPSADAVVTPSAKEGRSTRSVTSPMTKALTTVMPP
jgi:hypothetical protein